MVLQYPEIIIHTVCVKAYHQFSKQDFIEDLFLRREGRRDRVG
jgi:hypothetical protein